MRGDDATLFLSTQLSLSAPSSSTDTHEHLQHLTHTTWHKHTWHTDTHTANAAAPNTRHNLLQRPQFLSYTSRRRPYTTKVMSRTSTHWQYEYWSTNQGPSHLQHFHRLWQTIHERRSQSEDNMDFIKHVTLILLLRIEGTTSPNPSRLYHLSS